MVTIGSQYVYGDEVGGTSKHIVGMEGVNMKNNISIKIEIIMSLTNLYKLNVIKCSLGCILF